MKRVMGVDYGDARTGIAVSDLLCSIVGSTTVIHSRNKEKTIAQIKEMVEKMDVGEIVVGLPKNMNGTEGPKAARIRELAALIEQELPVYLMDERMTTMSAARYLNETNTRGKKRRGVIDTLSAQIILQNALDRLR